MRCLRLASFLVFSLGNGFSVLAEQSSPACQRAFEALQRSELQAAVDLLKQCMSAYPNQLRPYLDLCAIYQFQGKTQDLHRVALEGLKRFPEEKRFYLTVGNLEGQNGDYQRAVEVFTEANRRWPGDPIFRYKLSSAHLLLGMKLLDSRKDKEAEQELRQAVALKEDDVEARLNLGRALHNLGRSVEAEAEFDRVITLNHDTPLAYFHRGLVRASLGKDDEAIADLSREIKANPNYPPSYLLRGEVLYKKGDWTSALSDLNVVVRQMPRNARAIFLRGRCLSELGRTKEAEVDFRKASELEPDSPALLYALAQLLWRTDRKEEAQRLFQIVRERTKAVRAVEAGQIQFKSVQPAK